jgi:hypothetical protein
MLSVSQSIQVRSEHDYGGTEEQHITCPGASLSATDLTTTTLDLRLDCSLRLVYNLVAYFKYLLNHITCKLTF